MGSAGASGSASDNALAWTLAVLARRACAEPVVTGSSGVMTRALAWVPRLRGTRATVMLGSAAGDAALRYWIEVDDAIIDVSGAEVPLVADEVVSEPGSSRRDDRAKAVGG